MRVLHFITVSEAGGAQRVVASLANGLAAVGEETAVASDSGGPLWDILDPRVRRFEIPGLKKRIDPLSDFRAFLGFRRVLREYKPDILHLHSSKAGALGRLFSRRTRAKIVYTVHGFDTIRKAHGVFLPVERALSGACAAIVAVSEYDRQGLAECGITRAVYVIHNGIEDLRDSTSLNGEINRLFQKDREDGYSIVLSIARMAVPKRYDLFRDVAVLMRDEPVRFYWMGGGPQAPSMDIPSNVRYLGDVFNAGAYIGKCDVFTLLSDFEGLPISILEALSCGKPIVASRVGGVPEELQGGAGILVENDATEVERAIRKVLRSPDLRKTLAKLARSQYLKRFGERAMCDSYRSLYQAISCPDLEEEV